MLIIQNVLIHDLVNKEPYFGQVWVNGKHFYKITRDQCPLPDAEIIDATNLSIYPGFIDAHSHIGLDGFAIGYEGHDYCELNDPVTPQLRAIDSLNPQDHCFELARKSGVTCVATGPGSANAIGGLFTIVKTFGISADEMVVKDPAAMKCAFGENPKNCYRENGISTRMTIAAEIRQALMKARDYWQRKEAAGDDPLKKPPFDFKSESLIPLLRGDIPLKAHAHQANDILTALRIAEEFHLRITLEHVTDGALLTRILAQKNVPLAIGPSMMHASKYELKNKSFETPGLLAKAGCHVSIITDAPFSPQEYLTLCARLAIRAGMDAYEALKSITINPAAHLEIADRVGSIEVGKDADFVITDGDPLDPGTHVLKTFIDGTCCYNSEG